MPGAGQTTVDFGAWPGNSDASVAITSETAIDTTSLVEAWLMPTSATVDHSTDEHLVDGPRVMAMNLIAGTGFTIFATAADRPGGTLHGQWRVGWVWYTP